MNEALRPLHRLEAEAAKENEIAQQAYAAGLDAYKLRQQVKASLEKEALKKDPKRPPKGIDFTLGDEPKAPPLIRYCTNDSSYEKLGELLLSNPSGILVERDELVSLLQHLDRDDQSVARGFYLSGWSGQQSYSFDRIVRGHLYIDAACLTVLGNTQPARIGHYIRRANYGGAFGDGLIQRFGLMSWPDAPATWKNIDEYPNNVAREKAWQVYERASKIDESEAFKLGAEKGRYDSVPYLRSELSPAFEGHLAKYRKLVPSLALINHLADGGAGPVSQRALLKALAMADYLESHARRIYGSADQSELQAAKAILKHITSGDLTDEFTARDLHQRGWAHLTEREQVGAGLNLLLDLDYLPNLPRARRRWAGGPKSCI